MNQMTIVNDSNNDRLDVTIDDSFRIMLKKWLNMAAHDQRVVFPRGQGCENSSKAQFFRSKILPEIFARLLPYSTASVRVCEDDYFILLCLKR